MLVVGGHNTVVLGGEAAWLANTLASRSEQAARASPKGSLRLLCADGAGVLGFVHESALFHGRKGSWEEFVHGIGLFRGRRECFGVFVHESALFHGRERGFMDKLLSENFGDGCAWRPLAGASGELVEAEAEFRGHGQEMVKDVGLDGLELVPDLIGQEEIHFDWQSELARLPLRYYEVEVLSHHRVPRQVQTYIYTVKL